MPAVFPAKAATAVALPRRVTSPRRDALTAQFSFAPGLLRKTDCARYAYYANQNARALKRARIDSRVSRGMIAPDRLNFINPIENTVNEEINEKRR